MSLSFAVRYPDSFGSLLMIPTLIRSPLELLPAADVSPAPSFVSVAPQAASPSTFDFMVFSVISDESLSEILLVKTINFSGKVDCF